MIEIGHADKFISAELDVEILNYQPAGTYSLDIEIFSVSSLRKRFSQEQMRLPHQYDFGMLLFVTEGECIQWIDFVPVNCKVGSLLTLSPGQVHRFGAENDWGGWIMLFRPEFMPRPAISSPQIFNFRVKELTQEIPDHLLLGECEQHVVACTIEQMKEDSKLNAASSEVNTLLHHQFFALLQRVTILYGRYPDDSGTASNHSQRFKAFKNLLEENYARWHQVSQYAKQLGCSEKSLSRAVVQATGVTAKNLISSRINLEAKRLLVSSTMSVALIAEQLGFEEPTNFVKFFKRQVACTPGEFRKEQRIT